MRKRSKLTTKGRPSILRWPNDGYMETTVSIDAYGNLTGTATTQDKNNVVGFPVPLGGFNGAVAVELYGQDGKPLTTFAFGPYGLQWDQNRVDNISATVPTAILDALYSVSVTNCSDPQFNGIVNVWQWIKDNQSTIAALAKIVGSAAAGGAAASGG